MNFQKGEILPFYAMFDKLKMEFKSKRRNTTSTTKWNILFRVENPIFKIRRGSFPIVAEKYNKFYKYSYPTLI